MIGIHEKDKLASIVFIELKRNIQLKEMVITQEIPLPLRMNQLVEGIQTQELAEQLQLEKVLDGILYLMGLDETFKYREEYKKIVQSSIQEPKRYAMAKAIDAEKVGHEDAYIYLKGYENLFGEDEQMYFTLTSLMETIYNEQRLQVTEKQQEKTLREIIGRYEHLIFQRREFDLPYLRLGYINLSLERFIKSKLYFEKFLTYSKREELKNEVRVQITELEDYAAMESAQTYLSYGKFDEALSYLQKISRNYPNRKELNYLLGLCYYNLSDIHQALSFAEQCCEEELKEEYVNLLGMIYFQLQQREQSKAIYRKGIAQQPDSYLLNYNLGVILVQSSQYSQAIQYLKKAYQLQSSEELLSYIQKLEKTLDKN